MEIKIGTSGYSFDDWVGPFYPEKTKKGKMLDYYIKHFNTVEINSTYYRIPHPAIMANIEKKTPDNFEFIIKAPGTLTHKRYKIEKDIIDFKECIEPITNSGKLKGVLAQFPFSFKHNEKNLDYVYYCNHLLQDYSLFVEFRHDSWVNREMYDMFKKSKIGYVSVDEPDLPGLIKPELFNTIDTGYIRLHGRNAKQWWNGGALRYDYDYSEAELNEWREKIKKLENKAKKLYIFFNNCHLGQAVKNAKELTERLNL
ncbi:MAG: DUF72 domain-containing protein [Candidatus Zixiibacteriota bacterium]